MTELLTAVQMRVLEQGAIDSGEVTGLALMERAGEGVIAAIHEEWPEFIDQRGPAPAPPEYLGKKESQVRAAVVLCGPGNNGGDGFVVARLLHGLGWGCEVFLYGDAERLSGDAQVNYARWLEVGLVRPLSELSGWEGRADIVVDALFGTGLNRALEGAVFERVATWLAIPGATHHIVALDMPSGICADSGRNLWTGGEAVPSALTVSFHRPKLGHYLGVGPFRSGKLVSVDLGLEQGADRAVVALTGSPKRPHIAKFAGAHKFDHGHALVLSGGVGRGGAARLAARGALRIGAGLVSLGCPEEALAENAAQLTAIMLRVVKGPQGLAEILLDRRISSVCLGPGLGLDRSTGALVEAVLGAQKPCVLDADALSIYEDNEDTLFGMLHGGVVLTPHAGEFARLWPDIAARLGAEAREGPAYSKVEATRDAAKRAGCTVLFKGADTVIAAPDGRCVINSAQYGRAAPWLATAGSGDVLAGFVTGLLARGLDPLAAAGQAAWLHVECARAFGPGLIAEDLPEELPKLFRKLGL